MISGPYPFFPFLNCGGSDGEVRVYCFNHAGGSASSYYHLMKNISGAVEIVPVELAGHGSRMDEPFERDWDSLVNDCCDAVLQLQSASKKPFVLLGCSLGALIAFRCALRLEKLGTPAQRLILCAHSAPQLPVPGYKSSMGIEMLPEEVMKLGGLSEELIRSEEFHKYFLPIIFLDYQLHDSFKYQGERLMKTPVDSFYGSGDIYFGRDSMLAWSSAVEGGVSCTEIEGNHFFAYSSEKFQNELERICLIVTNK